MELVSLVASTQYRSIPTPQDRAIFLINTLHLPEQEAANIAETSVFAIRRAWTAEPSGSMEGPDLLPGPYPTAYKRGSRPS
jgi:hypothetical protein